MEKGPGDTQLLTPKPPPPLPAPRQAIGGEAGVLPLLKGLPDRCTMYMQGQCHPLEHLFHAWPAQNNIDPMCHHGILAALSAFDMLTMPDTGLVTPNRKVYDGDSFCQHLANGHRWWMPSTCLRGS